MKKLLSIISILLINFSLFGQAKVTQTVRIPTQTGNSGKYLKTNGTQLSWDTPGSSSLSIVVTPEDFGAVGNGITNDQAALQSAVNYNGGNVIVNGITGKTYYTATTFTTGDNVKMRDAVFTTTNNISILTIKGKNNVVENCTFRGNSTGTSQRGIDLTGVSTFTLYYIKNKVEHCNFENLGGAGIYVTNIIGSSSGTKHEGAVKVNNSTFDGCLYGVNCAVRGEYNSFDLLTVANCSIGVSFTGGNNYISNSTITDNTTGLEVLSGTNDGHGSATNCALNHNTINNKNTHANGYSYSNCKMFAGGISNTGTGTTVYDNDDFSMSGFNFVQTNSPVIMNGSIMSVLPANFNLTGQKPILNNCYSGTNILCWPDRTFIPSYTLTANATFTVPYSWGIESITFVNTTANAVTGGIRIGTTNGGTEVVTAQAIGANEQVQVPPQDIKKYFFAFNGTTTLYVQAVTAWNSASVRMVVKLKQWNNF